MGSEDTRVVRAVGDYFRRARETLGWTLGDVVERASKEGARFSVANLSRFERGLAEFSLMDAYAIARALGTPLAYLEEVIRAAKTRQDVNVTDRSFEELLSEGNRLIKLGEVARGVALLEAAQDRLLLEGQVDSRNESMAEVLILLADGHTRLRHFALAADLAARALALHGISTDKHALALLRLVSVYYMTGNFQRSRVYANRVRDLLPALAPRTRALATSYFGSLELKEDRWLAAIPYFEEAGDSFSRLDDIANLLVSRANLGFCLARAGKRHDGVRLLEYVIDQAAERSLKALASLALRYLGMVLTDAASYSAARAHLDSAAGIARSVGATDDLFRAWFLIWKLESACGTPEGTRAAHNTLSRLLRRVDPRLPEAEEFVASAATMQTDRRDQ